MEETEAKGHVCKRLYSPSCYMAPHGASDPCVSSSHLGAVRTGFGEGKGPGLLGPGVLSGRQGLSVPWPSVAVPCPPVKTIEQGFGAPHMGS